MLGVKIKLVRPGATVPEYATEGSAGADLRACVDEPVTIAPGEIVPIPTGIAVEPERGDVAAFVYGRSGLGAKHGVTPANSVGVIDSDYRGEISVVLINKGKAPYIIMPGERIAQLIFTPVLRAAFTPVDSLSDTPRGSGGFGSTGR